LYKVGIIGSGNQSARIQKILKKLNKKFYIYKPERAKNYYDNNSFQNLKKCKIIFILSPNKTHFYYIKLLAKNRYIFCEKPPVTNIRQLKLLSRYNNGNIYFNFNFRFSTFNEILKNHKKYNLGKLLGGNIYACHGLSFKKEYIKNWRSNKKYNPLGVLEMVLVHYIDMINFNFSLSRPTSIDLNNFSKKGTSPDTCNISFKHGNSKIDFFATYSSPFYQKILLLFENGYIEQKDNLLEIRGPRMILNKKGQFIKPKLIKKINSNQLTDFNHSLLKSVKFFLNVVLKKKKFSKVIFVKSISSNKLILNL
tara:strand:+ start:191 stop:1117 length:927 start_codon:yes stop_codon:yes gene_type:complete